MSSKKSKPRDTPIPSWPPAIQAEWRGAIELLQKESDRGVALLGAAYLDTALGALIEASLACDKLVTGKLLNSPGPIATFSARIALAYGLGHIGPQYFQTLEAVREVRNAFAHFRRTLSFEDPEIRKCIEVGFKIPYVLDLPNPNLSLMRNRYIWTTAMLLGRIAFLQLHVKRPSIEAGT